MIAPLQMHYAGTGHESALQAPSRIWGDNPKRKLRLEAGAKIEIHPYIPSPFRSSQLNLPSHWPPPNEGNHFDVARRNPVWAATPRLPGLGGMAAQKNCRHRRAEQTLDHH